MNRSVCTLWTFILCLAVAMPSLAQQLSTLKKNSDGWYVITSDRDFEQFRDSVVAIGDPYAKALLTADITVRVTPVGCGDEQFHFRGTFDGQGHTITMVSMMNRSEVATPWGLFQFTKPGCVIRNLKVSGSLQSHHPYVGAIVGDATGTRIVNCVSDATVHNFEAIPAGTDGDGVGGILGVSHGETFIENCAFIGSIIAPNCTKTRGMVGTNAHMVNIKSCYVMATFEVGDAYTHDYFTDFRSARHHTFLNNYYCVTDEASKVGSANAATQVSATDVQDGHLCQRLNVGGRNGIVWYQHDGFPYPFRGAGGRFVSIDGDVVTMEVECQHDYVESTHICRKCGYIDPSFRHNIEPLQLNNSVEGADFVEIGYLRYKLDADRSEASVYKLEESVGGSGPTPSKDWWVRAIHVPESINIGGKTYAVTRICEGAFDGSHMEHCYIPGSVRTIENNAFNNCSSLTDLHIADAAGGSVDAAMFLGLNGDEALFKKCALKRVYIGRDMKWETSSVYNYKEPFSDCHSITDVVFGPRVTRVGNYYDDDARKGYAYDLFNDCEGIRRVYILGDEPSLYESPLMFYSRDGLGKATDYYINRTVGYTQYWEYSSGYATVMGCLDYCAHAAYGPFATCVTERSFNGTAANHNTYLKSVDFTNAFRLKEIGYNAFNECPDAKFTGLFGQYPLTKIGHDAFYNCDNLYAFDFGSHIETIEYNAFNDCDKLAYVFIPASLTSLGDKAFCDCRTMGALELEDSDLTIKFSTLKNAFKGCKLIASVHFGRQVDYDTDGDSPFIDAKEALISASFGPKVKNIRSLFYGIKALRNVSFQYSPEPLYFLRSPGSDLYTDGDNAVTSLMIDRLIVSSDGTILKGENWGNLRKSIIEITFGNNIDRITDQQWENFNQLKVVSIPTNIKSIGAHAFEGASELNTVMIMGAPEIGEEAFAACPKIESLVFGDGRVKVASNAFVNSDKIEEILLISDGENMGAGATDAFSATAYAKTRLYSPYDTNTSKVDFTVAPWRLFQNHPFRRNNDFDGSGDIECGDYEHATIAHPVTADQYEVVNIPFEWDSYYFGANAEVYSLKREGATFDFAVADHEGRVEGMKCFNSMVSRIDIENTKILPRGIYIIKSRFNDDCISAWRDFYHNSTISVDNRPETVHNAALTAEFAFGGCEQEVAPQADAYEYVVEDGVIKLVNGGSRKHRLGDVVYRTDRALSAELACNNIVCDSELPAGVSSLLLTSRRAVPFHEKLEGYTTFFDERHHVLAPSWCRVYVVTGEEGGKVQIEEIPDRIITAAQPVIIRSSLASVIGDDDFMTYVTDASQHEDIYARNLLHGVSSPTPVDDVSGASGFVYVLSTNASATKTGFYRFSNGKTLAAGKAYLLPSDFSAEARACLFSFSDFVDAVGSVRSAASASPIYDLSGRRLSDSGAKGVHIINNKKVMK